MNLAQPQTPSKPPSLLLRLAQASFMLLLFSVPLMRLGIVVLGFYAIAADAVYLMTLLLWSMALMRRQTDFRWHPFYWLLLAYFAALALSAAFSPDRGHGFAKLMTQVYLLSLPVLAMNLLRNRDDLVRAILTWLRATALIAILAPIVFLLFYTDRDNIILRNTLFHFGSLPPGNYPRMSLTFGNANMLCNYLTVSVAVLVIAWNLKIVGNLHFWLLFAGTLFAAAFTISPGLGGIALVLGCFAWMRWSHARPAVGWSAASAGALLAVAFLLAAAIAPLPHPTAPFTMHLPLVGTVWPSGRLMLWLGSIDTFLDHPWLGAGLGQNSAQVSLLDPSGRLQSLTDGHNSFLNVAAQAGLPGLLTIGALTTWLLRRSLPLRTRGAEGQLRAGFAIAFACAFVYGGLAGSFEDARHLWLLIGLFLVAERLAPARREGPDRRP